MKSNHLQLATPNLIGDLKTWSPNGSSQHSFKSLEDIQRFIGDHDWNPRVININGTFEPKHLKNLVNL